MKTKGEESMKCKYRDCGGEILRTGKNVEGQPAFPCEDCRRLHFLVGGECGKDAILATGNRGEQLFMYGANNEIHTRQR